MPTPASRNVLLTGAAGGIGAVMAAALLAAGHAVAAVDRNAAGLGKLAALAGARERLQPIVADLADEAGCAQAIAAAQQRFGTIDAVINNAGIGMSSVRPDAEARHPAIEELAPEVYDRFLAIFVRAPAALVRAALPGMRARGFGRIVNNTTSYLTMLRVMPYGAAKAALEAMSAVWAKELEGSGVTVNVLVPGGRLAAGKDAAAADHGTADRVAHGGRGERFHRTSHHGGALGRKACAGHCGRAGEPGDRLAGARRRRGVAAGMRRVMYRLVYVFSLALVSLVATPVAAVAQSNIEMARSWGLLGTWRLDCDKPKSRANPDLKYVVRDGRLFHDRDFGDTTDSQPVIVATRRSDDSLELIVRFDGFGQTRQFVFVHGRSDTLRAVYNRDVESGELSIQDGKFTASGEPTAWQFRCE
jgi:NAD(P)-dependent dehydrogenase (short-subunit alcohol dehydrogenase family)